MTFCIVEDCQTNNRSNDTSISRPIRYSFPKDPNLKTQWCSMLGIREDDLCRNWKVCALHFMEKDFKNPKVERRVLYSCAIPSQNLGQSQTTNIINNCGEPIAQPKLNMLRIEKLSTGFLETIPIEENYREKTQENPKIYKIFSPSSFKLNIPIQDNYAQNPEEKPKILNNIRVFKGAYPIQENCGEKPKILKIEKISGNNGEKIQENSRNLQIVSEFKKMIPMQQNYEVKPKILKIASGFEEIPMQTNYEEIPEDVMKISNGFTEMFPLQENYEEITQDRPKILPTEKIKEIVPIHQNYGTTRCRFSLSLKEAKREENISTEDVICDEYKTKILLKNEVLRNTLKKRERMISTLRKKLSRKTKKITELETIINEFKFEFQVKKRKTTKCKN